MPNSKKNGKTADPTRFAGRIAAASASSVKSIIRLTKVVEQVPETLKGLGRQIIRPTSGQLDMAAKLVEAYAVLYAQAAKAGEDTAALLEEVAETVRKHRDRQGAVEAGAFSEALDKAMKKSNREVEEALEEAFPGAKTADQDEAAAN
jgi:hypothetical protein